MHRFLIFSLSALATSVAAQSTLSHQHLEQVNAQGQVRIVDDSSIAELQVDGILDVADSDIGSATVNGLVKARRTHIGTLSVASDTVILEDCDCGDIVVRPSSTSNERQELLLRGHTKVSGKIRFESGNGLVKVESPASSVGAVDGAVLWRRS